MTIEHDIKPAWCYTIPQLMDQPFIMWKDRSTLLKNLKKRGIKLGHFMGQEVVWGKDLLQLAKKENQELNSTIVIKPEEFNL